MQKLIEKQKKLEQLAAKQQQQQAEEAKNQLASTKKEANKTEKPNALIDSSSKLLVFACRNQDRRRFLRQNVAPKKLAI